MSSDNGLSLAELLANYFRQETFDVVVTDVLTTLARSTPMELATLPDDIYDQLIIWSSKVQE
jgi:hypothetical protein